MHGLRQRNRVACMDSSASAALFDPTTWALFLRALRLRALRADLALVLDTARSADPASRAAHSPPTLHGADIMHKRSYILEEFSLAIKIVLEPEGDGGFSEHLESPPSLYSLGACLVPRVIPTLLFM
jgi:hypothetical protein